MKSLGKLPNDPLVKSLNYIQWNWCYLNIIKDKEEEEQLWKDRLNYMGLYINPDLVKELTKYDNINSGDMESEQPIYSNDDFEKELREAMNNGGSESESTKQQFMELPNGHYGDSSMSSSEFVKFINSNIDSMEDLQQEIDKQHGLQQDEDIDVIEINE